MRSAFAVVAFLFLLPLQQAGAEFMVSVYADVNTPPGSIPYDEIDGLVLAFLNPTDNCRGFTTSAFPAVQDIVRAASARSRSGLPSAATATNRSTTCSNPLPPARIAGSSSPLR